MHTPLRARQSFEQEFARLLFVELIALIEPDAKSAVSLEGGDGHFRAAGFEFDDISNLQVHGDSGVLVPLSIAAPSDRTRPETRKPPLEPNFETPEQYPMKKGDTRERRLLSFRSL